MKYISVLVFEKDAVSFTAFLLSPRASYVLRERRHPEYRRRDRFLIDLGGVRSAGRHGRAVRK